MSGELVSEDAARAVVARPRTGGKGRMLHADSLSQVFGIDLVDGKAKAGKATPEPSRRAARARVAPARAKPKSRGKTTAGKGKRPRKPAR